MPAPPRPETVAEPVQTLPPLFRRPALFWAGVAVLGTTVWFMAPTWFAKPVARASMDDELDRVRKQIMASRGSNDDEPKSS
ncbi:hypothetical protein AMAG_20059 [Allomyces macrogynus ATCC 38327]|uniref:Transmembrane protein n=1 Tax=Allomyces macrogynus (strain ATCC 38327) TaxID=578462 RepID=A0A0L0T4W2_ALLM3|nr:hypothetical protein AMAG_20059 [Allomyces macrogynus ATCC 38327]|eukprot:KNE69848.1 hypothetical protein AMAG_20059 [Allomyces macrogynus ATCC 38327]